MIAYRGGASPATLAVVPGRLETPAVIPGRHDSGEPGIHSSRYSCGMMDSGFDAPHRPGMTARIEAHLRILATEFRPGYEKITRPKNRGRRESRVPSRHP